MSDLLPSDRKTICDARTFTKNLNENITQSKRDFAAKGGWGLYWDAVGMFNTSNKQDVLAHMEKYAKFYEEVANCIEMAARGDENAYEKLLAIYSKMDDMEKEAKKDHDSTNSRALMRATKNFLDQHCSLDHKMKKVECVVLRRRMAKMEETCKKSEEAVADLTRKIDQLNVDANCRVNKLCEENEELKRMIMEGNQRAEERCKKMAEDHDRKMQQILEIVKEMLRQQQMR